MHFCAAESFPTPLRGHSWGCLPQWAKQVLLSAQRSSILSRTFLLLKRASRLYLSLVRPFGLLGVSLHGSWFPILSMSRELETEDACFKVYLEEHGYDISLFGEVLVVNQRLSSHSSSKECSWTGRYYLSQYLNNLYLRKNYSWNIGSARVCI